MSQNPSADDTPPPAYTRCDWSATREGVWLRFHPAEGEPVAVLVPNRWLAGLARILGGRAELVAAERLTQRDR